MFECVVNLSEGRAVFAQDLARNGGPSLCDLHSDTSHHRSVVTLINEPSSLRRDTRALIDAAMRQLDLRDHRGVHPRFGVADVVPFVALDPTCGDVARELRDETARWLAATWSVPVFLYGPLPDGTTRSLPEVRRNAFRSLSPDFGPARVDPRRGASALGQRSVLVAWNMWVRAITLEEGRRVARTLRDSSVRALAFAIPGYVQLSFNLVDPTNVGPSVVYDRVRATLRGGTIDHAELVGLIPRAVLEKESRTRWDQLGLREASTIEAALERRSAGLSAPL